MNDELNWDSIRESIEIHHREVPTMYDTDEVRQEEIALDNAKKELGIDTEQIAQIFKAQKLADAQLRKERADLRIQKRAEPRFKLVSESPINVDLKWFDEFFEPVIIEAMYRPAYSHPSNTHMFRLKEHLDIRDYFGKTHKYGPFKFDVEYDGDIDLQTPTGVTKLHIVNDSKKLDAKSYVTYETHALDSLYAIAFLKNRHDIVMHHMAEQVAEQFEIDVGEIDTAGYDDIVDRMVNIVETQDPRVSNRHIILVGPPGTGKSMLAKRLVQRTPNWLHYSVVSGDTSWMSKLKDVNKLAVFINKKMMILIDEIDEIGLNRDVSRSAVYELMRVMDGIADTSSIKFVATTNRPGDLDAALLRVGRFGPVIFVGEPNTEQKESIINYYAKKFGVTIDAPKIRNGFTRVTGCDIRAAFESCIIQKEPITTENVIHHLDELLKNNKHNTDMYV